ncbi:hypothetical protein A1O7_01437 [Cladophialophora yegresii CBS 114405]|uniref:SET domain-containing protein n=1 Tax=Cladophialophora yegresii CBS 114405 TaxID=1182544 RepID=W9WAE9_9EURO|nr:uncharacterized protein A1O7_01437 [Cladophialophora yegresii CBS 114405]EXJ65097.1 hypothetical protein A1O7_01437 [Cladophialophora yegresii CBS 114405]
MKLSAVSLGVLSLCVSLVASSQQDEFHPSSETFAEPEHHHLELPASNEAPKHDHVQLPSGQAQEDPTSYFPWTHKPICTKDADDDPEDQFCVYTNASFSNGRGISIFTRPAIAREFASLPPFQDPTALSSNGINLDSNAKDLPWYTAFVPGKGMGMFASRPLHRGDLITAYTPCLVTHIGDLRFTDDRERMLRLAINQLPPATTDAYLALAKVYDEPEVVAQDILKANGFEMKLGDLMHPAVFPEASRYNHACAPNAQYFLSASMLTHYVHAVRPIAKDEEITISYAPPLRLRADRQNHMQSIFQFTCTCERCSSGSHTARESDKATQDIVNLQWELDRSQRGDRDAPGPGGVSVKKAEQLVALYKAEGLDGFLDTAYGYAALAYNTVGGTRGAMKYARLAAEATRLRYPVDEEGVGLQKVREWEGMARDPMGHPSWRNSNRNRQKRST